MELSFRALSLALEDPRLRESLAYLSLLIQYGVFLALTLKLSEIAFHLVLAVRTNYPRELAKAITSWKNRGISIDRDELLSIRRACNWPESPDQWPITGLLLRYQFPGRRIFVNYCFRYQVLMGAASIVTAFSPLPSGEVVGATLLFLGIWIEISRLILDRLIYGFADSYFRRTSLRAWIGPAASIASEEVAATRQDKLLDVLRLFCGIVGVVILAYAAIYSAVDSFAGEQGAFTGIPKGGGRILHFLFQHNNCRHCRLW